MFDVEVVEKVSKSGSSYIALELKFPNGYIKTVFLDKAEQYFVSDLIEQ